MSGLDLAQLEVPPRPSDCTTYKATTAGHHTSRARSSIAVIMLSSISSVARRLGRRPAGPGFGARRLLAAVAAPAFFAAPIAVPAAGPAWATAANAPAASPVARVPKCPPGETIASLPPGEVRPGPYDHSRLSERADPSRVTVAVIDSGVDASHPQLRGVVGTGIDLLDPGGDGRIDCVAPAGHGTAVASIIAAQPVAGVAFAGLAPGVRILPVRVSERVQEGGVASGAGDVSDLASGILAAVASRPKPAVINLSISTTTDSPQLREAVAAALRADIVVVAAVGNDPEQGDQTPYPAAYDGVVGVGAIGRDGSRWAASRVGPYVDLVAPGEQLVAAMPGGGYMAFEGTSFATPLVSATAALVRARFPELDQAEVVRRLLATADPGPGSPLEYGYGVLNPLRALTEIVEPVLPAPTAAVARPPVAIGSDDPAAHGPTLAAAAGIALAALATAAVAAAVPGGRRRGWRPGGR